MRSAALSARAGPAAMVAAAAAAPIRILREMAVMFSAPYVVTQPVLS